MGRDEGASASDSVKQPGQTAGSVATRHHDSGLGYEFTAREAVRAGPAHGGAEGQVITRWAGGRPAVPGDLVGSLGGLGLGETGGTGSGGPGSESGRRKVPAVRKRHRPVSEDCNA